MAGRTRNDKHILAIVLLGIIIASYAVTLHFSPSASNFCNISSTVNCDKVNKSPWALFLGVPVAVLGLLSYLFVFLVVLKRHAIERFLAFEPQDFAQYLFFLTVAMLGFQIYLTAVEVFLIHAYCIVCLASQLCTILLAFFVMRELMGKSA